jgi:Rap1a immunity proteins
MRCFATTIVLMLLAFASADRGNAEEDRGSASYLVALCKTYLDLVDKEADTLQNMGRTESARLTAAGVCVGFIVGVLETLRSVNLSCIPKNVSNVQLIRTVLKEIEDHPEQARQDFGASVRAAMMKSWPCRKKKGSRLVSQPRRQRTTTRSDSQPASYRNPRSQYDHLTDVASQKLAVWTRSTLENL